MHSQQLASTRCQRVHARTPVGILNVRLVFFWTIRGNELWRLRRRFVDVHAEGMGHGRLRLYDTCARGLVWWHWNPYNENFKQGWVFASLGAGYGRPTGKFYLTAIVDTIVGDAMDLAPLRAVLNSGQVPQLDAGLDCDTARPSRTQAYRYRTRL
jgi:hypothetical protein